MLIFEGLHLSKIISPQLSQACWAQGVEAFPAALSPFFLLRVEQCPRLEMRSSLRCRVDGEVESQFGVITLKDWGGMIS